MSSRPPAKSFALRVVHSSAAPARRGMGLGQMSPANAFEGRGRSPFGLRMNGYATRSGRLSPRVITFACPPDRDAFMSAWGRFIRATTRDREDCARVYGTTFQTACNWYDGARVPTGDKVQHAYALHPGPASAILGAGA